MDPLPVPAQLVAQLDKCKTVRKADEYHKSRTKTAKEMEESKAKLPDLPTISK
eukprot:Nitzschia sp. Nitz4//scaffold12_size214221//127720//127970//NITZ4_001508-RA/size214221-exonerate_est2genome-gene-0.221-mRNA-1//-1//CDS//3329535044//4797//frame0